MPSIEGSKGHDGDGGPNQGSGGTWETDPVSPEGRHKLYLSPKNGYSFPH